MNQESIPTASIINTPQKPPAFAQRLHGHLIDIAPELREDGYSPRNLDDHILSEAKWAWDGIAERNLLHKYAGHVRSSQAFAVNLFGPLDQKSLARILSGVFGPIATVEQPVFEFEDLEDRLRESQSKRPHRTQIDVVLRGTTTSNKPVALLVEVKLSEDDFGHCSAFKNPNNDSRHTCNQSGPFGGDTNSCFQLRNHGNGRRRLYDKYIPNLIELVGNDSTECWFKTSASQPMRNVALAGVLRDGGIDARYAVCAPILNREIWKCWDAVQQVLPPEMLVTLPAELVIALHSQNTYAHMRDRYLLNEAQSNNPQASLERITWEIIASLDSRYEHNLIPIEKQVEANQIDCIASFDHDPNNSGVVIEFNRNGKVDILRGPGEGTIDNLRDVAQQKGPDVAADIIANATGLSPRRPEIDSTWNEFGRVVELYARAGLSVGWKTGLLDTADPGHKVRDDWYKDLNMSVPDNQSSDFLKSPARSNWFLVQNSIGKNTCVTVREN